MVSCFESPGEVHPCLEDLVILTLVGLNLHDLLTHKQALNIEACFPKGVHVIYCLIQYLMPCFVSCHLLKALPLVFATFLPAGFPSGFPFLLSLRRKISPCLCLEVWHPLVRSEALSCVLHLYSPCFPGAQSCIPAACYVPSLVPLDFPA